MKRWVAIRRAFLHGAVMPRGESIDVHEYLDYRAYLRDHYLERKKNGNSFSYRAFSQRAGLKSPNYLKLVIDGARNLSGPMAEKFAAGCGLAGEAASYFVSLVGFNQATSAVDRNAYYDRLTASAGYRRCHKLELAHASYHSTWYVPAIRELAARADFRADPQWISNTLVPSISTREAKRALSVLFELELLIKEPDGSVRQSDSLVATEAETRSLHIANYHRAMMKQAADAIELFASEERDISSVTVCIGTDGIGHLKRRLQRFRREIVETTALEDEPLRVVQINFQLFPLSQDIPLDDQLAPAIPLAQNTPLAENENDE